MCTNRTNVSFKNFFIYNVSYGQKEGAEEKKIMYYYPKGTNIDIKIKDVGLSEAIVKFASTFSADSCQALHTEKTKRFFFEPEPNFWMVLTLNVPMIKKGRDGMDGTEYHGYEVHDEVFSRVLKQSYMAARLFIGPFTELLNRQSGDTELLKRKLDTFFSKYLSYFMYLTFKNVEIVSVFQGVHFLPLDKGTFFQAQSYINLIESTIPLIDFSVLVYNKSIVWSGLPPEDIQILFRYITTSLLPSIEKADKESDTIHFSNSPCFISGQTRNSNDISYSGKTPKVVYLHSVPKPGFYYLLIYKYLLALMCWFVPCEEKLTCEFTRQLESKAKSGLIKLTEEISTYKGADDDQAKFVYFNKTNMAVKLPREMTLSWEALSIFMDIHLAHAKIESEGCMTAETFVKTTKEEWVVGRMSNFRELYLTLDKKNLIEANEEANKICSKHLKSIFFHV